MKKKQYLISSIFLLFIGLILLFELIRDSSNAGDFIGYVNAGKLALNNQDIYSDYLNTWPPLFSVFSILLAMGDAISSYGIRFLWLLGNIVVLYFIVSTSVKIVYNKKISLKSPSGIKVQELIVIIPILILMRFIMDNFTNVQINIYMLFCTLLCILFFVQKKYLWVGFFLGLTISLKVYTIFFLFYFLYKREFKVVAWSFLFLIVFNSVSFLVFGFDQAMEYYQHWVAEIAPRSYIANHNNQSIFGAFLRFFTTEDPSQNLYTNIFNLSPLNVKRATYLTVAIASILPAILFRKKLEHRSNISAIIEYSIIFTVIPLLSPIAWKAYFVFLWVPYFLLFTLLFRSNSSINSKTLQLLKGLFWFSAILNVLSSQLFVGSYFSDVLESYSCIAIGTIIVLIIQLVVYINVRKFDITTVKLNFKT